MKCQNNPNELNEDTESSNNNDQTIDQALESKWMAISSMVSGILALLAALNEIVTYDTLCGIFLLSVTGLVLGIISLVQKRGGKGMAIAGIITAAIAML